MDVSVREKNAGHSGPIEENSEPIFSRSAPLGTRNVEALLESGESSAEVWIAPSSPADQEKSNDTIPLL